MRFFIIKTMMRQAIENCILDHSPEGAGPIMHKLMFGDPTKGKFPKDAHMFMDKAHPGIKVPSLVANTMSLLLVSQEMKDAIAALVKEDIEFLPVSIFNHKKRLASDRHFIVNPIGGQDCLDLKLSSIEYLDGDTEQIVGIDKYVFDPVKLSKAPHLFRIKEEKNKYVVSETLIWEFKKTGPTNVFLEEVEQSPVKDQDITTPAVEA
jgi:hypothetical protein